MRGHAIVFSLILNLLLACTASAQVYQYDTVGRLQAANYPDGSSIRYEYDANSNITRVRFSPAPAALPPNGVIDTPDTAVSIETGETVTFEGSGTDPDGAVPLAFFWDFDGGATNSSDEDPGAITFSVAGTFNVELTVTDATGLSDPTPDTVVVTVTEPVTPPPPPPSPTSSSGGGSIGLLALSALALLILVRRFRPGALIVALVLVPLQAVTAQQWVEMNSGVNVALNDVWGSAPNDVFAVGDGGTILHFDGNAWTAMASGTTDSLSAVYGYSASEVYAVGTGQSLLRYDGTSWAPFAGPVDATGGYADVWTAGAGEHLWVVAGRRAWYWDGATWTVQSFRNNLNASLTPNATMRGIGGTAASIITASRPTVGTDPVDGGVFANFRNVGQYDTHAVYAVDDTDIFVVGRQSRRFQGDNIRTTSQWRSINVMATALDVWGTSASNVYSVGNGGFGAQGRIAHYDGNANDAWTTVLDRPLEELRAIFGFSEFDAFVVGENGVILRLSEAQPPQTTANLPFAGFSEDNVNSYTGELVHTTTDLSIDTQMPMEFRRYYASNLWAQGTVGGALGNNWAHNYEWRLDENFGPNSDQIRITDYRGREYVFDYDGIAYTLVSPTWANVGLALFNFSYLFFDRDNGLRYSFDPTSTRLMWIEDRNGNRHSLTYTAGLLTAVTDGASGAMSFTYTPGGELERVSLVKSTTLETTFAYLGGALVSATSPSGVVTAYAYDNSDLLTSVEVGAGTGNAFIERTWEYDTQGRVAATIETNAGRFDYVYGTDQTSVLQPDNSQRRFEHDTTGRLTLTVSPLGAMTRYSYDSAGRRNGVVDPLGRETTWAYDNQSGHVSRITQPGGFDTTVTYTLDTVLDGADFWDLDVVTLPNTATIEFGFDPRGNMELLVDELGNSWLFEYDAAGNLTRSENPAGGVTTLDYFADGNVRSILDPNNNERLFSYDEFLRPTIDAFGSRSTEYVYGARPVPDQVRDRSGSVLDYTYDAAGRVARIDRSDGYFETYSYDGSGRLSSLNRAATGIWTFGYDSFGRLATVTDPNFRDSTYGYDADGRINQFRDADNRLWQVSHAADGQLATLTRPNGENISFEYTDPRGHLSAVTNGLERLGLTYDSMGRFVSAVDPYDRVNTMERNLRGDVQRVADTPASIARLFGTDVFGNVSQYTDPLGGMRQQDHGSDGLLDTVTDPLGNITVFGRDSENRVDSISYADGLNVTVDYAGSGLPNRIQGNDGTDVVIDSTPEGQILGGTELVIARTVTGKVGNNNGIGVAYNSDDRVSRTTFASGRFVDFEYNGRGDVVLVRDWLGAETLITPTDVGKVERLHFPNGIVTDYQYDRAQRINSIAIGGIGTITVNRDPLGRIDSVENTLPRPTGMPSEDRNFAYNLASQIDSGSYDARGNQLSSGASSHTWDALNRLVASQDGAESVVVGYDALGGITRVTATSEERVYVQNYALKHSRISIERDSAGNDLWYYVHTFNGRLLYRINPAGSRQFYHFDENGNTVLITSDSGAVIQSYFVAPHGEVLDQSGSVDNKRVALAEQGGMEIADTGTITISASFIDTNSGHYLDGLGIGDANSAIRLEFAGQYGRSVRPGYTIEILPDDSVDGIAARTGQPLYAQDTIKINPPSLSGIGFRRGSDANGPVSQHPAFPAAAHTLPTPRLRLPADALPIPRLHDNPYSTWQFPESYGDLASPQPILGLKIDPRVIRSARSGNAPAEQVPVEPLRSKSGVNPEAIFDQLRNSPLKDAESGTFDTFSILKEVEQEVIF